ncbi:MAG: peptidyl-prolyl cis-trans isomerase, partial [Chthoniobacteraceae bacterium]
LQLVDLENALVGRAMSQGEALTNFILNSQVVRHEADRLQIKPTEEEVKTAIMALPRFQTGGAFDSGKYSNFIEDVMAPYGFTATQLEDLVRDDLRVKKIKALLNTTFVASPASFREFYVRGRQKLDVSVIRFKSGDFLAGAQITTQDVNKAFSEHFDSFKSGEKRKVEFVTFTLPDADKSLAGQDRMAALKKLSEQAENFTQSMLDKGSKFADVAAKFNVPVTTTDLFTQAAPDPKIAKIPGIVDAAFHVSKTDPDSDAIPGENGDSYYVLHLDDVVPSKPLTFEEASPQIMEALKANRAHELLSVKAGEVRNQIAARIAEGKSFADAVASTGLKAEAFPPFSLAEPNEEAPDSREVMYASSGLAEGEISQLVPTADGGILVHLDKREPIDEATFAKDKPLLLPAFTDEKLNSIFEEWLRKQKEGAKIQILNDTPSPTPAKS